MLLHYEHMYDCVCVFCWTTSVLFDVFMCFAGQFVFCFYVFCWTSNLEPGNGVSSTAPGALLFLFRCTFFYLLNLCSKSEYFIETIIFSGESFFLSSK